MTQSASQLLQRIERFGARLHARNTQHISIDGHSTIIFGNPDRLYTPVQTAVAFHEDDSFVRGIMGAFGSGKTTACVNEIVRRACASPVWYCGRRKVRWAIVRNTSGELQTTTLNTWLSWFDGLGDIHRRQKPILTYEHTFRDDLGTVELEVIFLALDRPEDVRKVKSLELTGCYFNEMSEISRAAFSYMKGRVNRYPSHAFCPEPYWSGIIFDTNPPDDDHWLYHDFEQSSFEGHKLFRQPPALVQDDDGKWKTNPDADNVKNLPPDYYTKLAEGQSSEFIKVFCLGQYGSVGTGRLVFPEFNADVHAHDHVEAVQGVNLILGFDFGLTPACVVMQLDPRGRLLVLAEYVADRMGIRTLTEQVVLPSLARDFPYCRVGFPAWGDPAGAAGSQIMEEMSCIGELCSLGIETQPASTNDIEPRLSSIRFFLNRMVDGKPAFAIDRKRCPVLFRGFTKHYVYKRLAVSGEERYRDVPDKNQASHPMDALGYGAMSVASRQIAQEKGSRETVDVWNPVMRIF